MRSKRSLIGLFAIVALVGTLGLLVPAEPVEAACKCSAPRLSPLFTGSGANCPDAYDHLFAQINDFEDNACFIAICQSQIHFASSCQPSGGVYYVSGYSEYCCTICW